LVVSRRLKWTRSVTSNHVQPIPAVQMTENQGSSNGTAAAGYLDYISTHHISLGVGAATLLLITIASRAVLARLARLARLSGRNAGLDGPLPCLGCWFQTSTINAEAATSAAPCERPHCPVTTSGAPCPRTGVGLRPWARTVGSGPKTTDRGSFFPDSSSSPFPTTSC
jgi:hypothetical protein